MSADALNKLIEALEQRESNSNATFGIFQYGNDAGESFIKADKVGLQLFALELLKASANPNFTIHHPTKNIIPISWDEAWVHTDSDTLIQYIEPAEKGSDTINGNQPMSTVKNKLAQLGCVVALIILLVCVVVGCYSIIRWLF